jgi:myosin-crossreactive antigen
MRAGSAGRLLASCARDDGRAEAAKREAEAVEEEEAYLPGSAMATTAAAGSMARWAWGAAAREEVT